MATKLAVGPIPLYHQMEQDIVGRIAAGEFGVGELLPTEDQLGQGYGVSRITVRKALDSLFRQGLITRRRGVGSFVADHRSGVHAVHLSGSLDDFLQTAHELTPEILSLAVAPAPAGVARCFGVDEGSPVLRLELISSGDDGPLSHCDFFFPEAVIGALHIDDITRNEPIVRIVERLMGVRVARASQVIEADQAGALTAQYLGIAVGTPVLRTERTYFTSTGEPIEIARLHHHPTRYRYEVELRSRPYLT